MVHYINTELLKRVSRFESAVPSQTKPYPLRASHNANGQANEEKVTSVFKADRATALKPNTRINRGFGVLVRAYRRHVAFQQKQWHHRTLPQQDGNDFATGLWFRNFENYTLRVLAIMGGVGWYYQ